MGPMTMLETLLNHASRYLPCGVPQSEKIVTDAAFPKSLHVNRTLESMSTATSLANSRAAPSADVDLVGCWLCGGLDSNASLLVARGSGGVHHARAAPRPDQRI